MGILYGHDANVNGVNTMGSFSIKQFSDVQPVVASNTLSGNFRGCGNVDWEGEIMAYGYLPPYTTMFPGMRFAFSGTLGKDETGVTGDHVLVAGYARVLRWIIEGKVSQPGGYWTWTAEIGADPASGIQALAFSGATQSDATITSPAFFCVSSGALKLDTVPQDNITWMRLVIEAPVDPYVDTGLPGLYRRGKGNIDWHLMYRQRVANFSEFPAVDTVKQVQMFTTASLNYDLKFGKFSHPFDIKVEPKSKLPIEGTVVAQMTSSSGATPGYIKLPYSGTPCAWGTA